MIDMVWLMKAIEAVKAGEAELRESENRKVRQCVGI